MAEKRKDNKGRILRTGESQRADGRYAFKYTDLNGNVKFVYAWRLDISDPTPKGKRIDESLREKEKKIKKDLEDGILTNGITVGEMVTKCNELFVGKPMTVKNRQVIINHLTEDEIWNRKMDSIKMSEAKVWCKKQCDAYSFNVAKLMRTILREAFQTAMEDDLVRKNPFAFNVGDVLKKPETKTKEILTEEQEAQLLKFIWETDKFRKYYFDIKFMLNTGVRIAEYCGIMEQDIDFEAKVIRIQRQLCYNDREVYFQSTKSTAGVRTIPVSDEILDSVKFRIKENWAKGFYKKCDSMVLSFTNYGTMSNSFVWRNRMETIRQAFNRTHECKIEQLTPHTLRHTFCSRMAMAGMNPKTLQAIMGHSNMSLTMNYYTHVTEEDIVREYEKVFSKIV